MIIKNVEPGDVEVRKIILQKWGDNSANPIDIRSQVISFSVYEDIDEPSMILELTLVDSLNLVTNYPIIGEEVIEISFITPGRENVFNKKFNVYSVEGTTTGPTSRSSLYTIKAVTPLHYYSIGYKVKKSYNNTVEEIVKDIIKSVSSAKSIPVNISTEKTKGLVPITIPSLNPFEAIDFIRQRAVSATHLSGGVFLFYENQYGLHFKSIEGVIIDGKKDINSKVFTYEPNTTSDKQRMQYAYRNIINYSHLGKFDSVKKVVSGAISSRVEAINLLTKQKEVTDFNLSEKFSCFAGTDVTSSLPNTIAFLQKFKGDGEDFYMTRDGSKGNDFVDAMYGSRNSYASLFNENIVRLLINGDNYISVGDVVKLYLPETSGTTEKKVPDRMHSGNYLTTKLRHIITLEEGAKPKHQIAMDCARIGYK